MGSKGDAEVLTKQLPQTDGNKTTDTVVYHLNSGVLRSAVVNDTGLASVVRNVWLVGVEWRGLVYSGWEHESDWTTYVRHSGRREREEWYSQTLGRSVFVCKEAVVRKSVGERKAQAWPQAHV